MDAMAILLEDDAEVAPLFYQWIIHCLDLPRNTANLSLRVVGVSL